MLLDEVWLISGPFGPWDPSVLGFWALYHRSMTEWSWKRSASQTYESVRRTLQTTVGSHPIIWGCWNEEKLYLVFRNPWIKMTWFLENWSCFCWSLLKCWLSISWLNGFLQSELNWDSFAQSDLFWLCVPLHSDQRMLQGPDEGLSPTWSPPPPFPCPLPDPWPSEPSVPLSHHESALPRAPKAAGGITHGHRPAHLALPSGWKPGKWVWDRLEMHMLIWMGKNITQTEFCQNISHYSVKLRILAV